MCSPCCGVTIPDWKRGLMFQVERIKSPKYSVRVEVIECTHKMQENGRSVFFNMQGLLHPSEKRV